MTKISVIIPTKNQKEYIGRCLDSVLAQKGPFELEVLVGDDHSDDTTAEVVKKYAATDSRIRLFVWESSYGATRNVYELCCKMSGDYFAYLEGDDYWLDENKLQKQLDFLEKNPHYVACFHDICLIDEQGTPLNKKLAWITRKRTVTYRNFDGYHLPGHSSTWLRRNCYPEHAEMLRSIYQVHPQIGDRTAALCFLSIGKFGRIKNTLSCYRYVRAEKAQNNTSQFFPVGGNSVLIEKELLDKLQALSISLGRTKDFMQRRYVLFAKALVFAIINPSVENKTTLKTIFQSCKYKLFAILEMPFILLHLVYLKFFRA